MKGQFLNVKDCRIRGAVYLVATIATMTGLMPASAVSQEIMGRLLRPVIPGGRNYAKISGRASEASQADGESISTQRYGAEWAGSFADKRKREWFYSVGFEGLHLSDSIRLPDSKMHLDGPLQDMEFGLGSRRIVRNDDIYGWFGSLGSASDQPFASYHETSITLNAFYKLSYSRTTSWMFLANYSNRRSFLPDIPIAGAAYVYQPDRRTLLVAGMPFTMLRYPVGESTDLTLRYFVPDKLKLEASTKMTRRFSLLAGGSRDEDTYFLAKREEQKHRLYFEETRFFGGWEWSPENNTELRMTVGYSVDRHFYQGEDNDDSHLDRVNFQDSADLRISLSRRF